jgi:RNA polymerase sigma-70 factor (ECF subfamily)
MRVASVSERASLRPRAHGAAAGFQHAVAPHEAALRASALRLTRNRADADDLLQDALLRAFRFWDRYREEDSCRAWLQRILLNTFYSERRAHARRRALLASYAQTAPVAAEQQAEAEAAAQAEGPITHEELHSSLGALRPDQINILRLVDMHEHTYREAAARLACPIGTVMSRLHRARAALRSQLAQKAQRACA